MAKLTLALFDFDGTITFKDTLVDFIQYAVGKPAYYGGLVRLSPMLLAMVLKRLPNHTAKQRFIAYFFKGWTVEHFTRVAEQYAKVEIDKVVRPKAIEKINWHQQQGHRVVVVSASMNSWLQCWCDRHNLDLIATTLEVVEGKISGRFATPNCRGMEKVNRVKLAHDLSQYACIYAYGDSSGDREMLAMADKGFYKPFRH